MEQIKPEIFKDNWASLKKHRPEICERLKDVIIKKYELFKQPNCIPNVLVDGQPYYIGVVKDYCEEQFNGLELENVKQPIFCGFGLGYEVMYWMQHKATGYRTQNIIIIEKDVEMFMCALNITDIRKIIEHKCIQLYIGLAETEMYITFGDYFNKNIANALICGATQPVFVYSSMKIGKEYYLYAINRVYESIYHCIQNYGNDPEDSLIGLENMLANVGEIVNNPGINKLYDKFKGKPAIVVATGPSLKKNMHLLKGLEDKALILSVDASFKLLMKNGIKPHMVTSLEREHAVQQFFEKHDKEEVKDVYMTACPVLFNHVYESYVGPKIIVYRDFDHFKWLEIDRGILDIKLSASNMAFKIAEVLGCDPIILIGQDLAYGDNDETHATEVPFSAEGEKKFMVPGNYKDVKTNSGWYGFLKAYELDVNDYKGTCINCTEGGAFIQGTEISTFKETIDKYVTESFNPLEIIKENLKDFKIEDNIEKLRDKIDKTEADIKIIIEKCVEAVDICKKHKEELEGEVKIERLEILRKEIIKNRIEIVKDYTFTFQKFLMHVVQPYHLKFEMETIMMYTEVKDFLLQFLDWYAFIGDISEIILQSLLRAKEQLNAGN